MNKTPFKKYWLWPLLSALFALIVILIGWKTLESKRLTAWPTKYLAAEQWRLPQEIAALRTRTLTVSDLSAIQYWMTFDYLNKIFNLPSDYLQSTLNISDNRYPFLTLAHYSREERLNSAILLKEVQAAISHYLTTPKS